MKALRSFDIRSVGHTYGHVPGEIHVVFTYETERGRVREKRVLFAMTDPPAPELGPTLGLLLQRVIDELGYGERYVVMDRESVPKVDLG